MSTPSRAAMRRTEGTVHSNCPGAHGLSLFKTPARGWWSLPQVANIFVINNHKLDITSSLSDSNIMQYPFIYHYPIGSMYGIYANIGGILMVNVTIYSSTMDPMGYRISIILPRWIEAELVKNDVDHCRCSVCEKEHHKAPKKEQVLLYCVSWCELV